MNALSTKRWFSVLRPYYPNPIPAAEELDSPTSVFTACSINAGLRASTKQRPSDRPPQQKRAGVGSDRSTVKTGHDDVLFKAFALHSVCIGDTSR